MKRRRLKKSVKTVLIVFIIVIIITSSLVLVCSNNKHKDKMKNKSTVDLASAITSKLKDESIDKSFISWVEDNYKGSINKLNKLLKDKQYDKSMWHEVTGYSYIVLNDLYNKKYDNMDNVKIVETKDTSTISFVGDVSLADNWFIMPYYDSCGGISGILGDKMLDIMKSSDVMIANSEFTVSNRGYALPNKMYTFRAKPERLSIYDEMGVDMVTLANNHVYDYGENAFLDMLDAFDEYNTSYWRGTQYRRGKETLLLYN